MKSFYLMQEYLLTARTVDLVSDNVASFLSTQKLEKQEATRYRLSIEEILLQYLDQCKEGSTVKLTAGRRFFKPYLQLTIVGDRYNPYQESQNSMGTYSSSMLKTLSLTPDYNYVGTENRFLFHLKKKRLNPIFSLLIAIVSALLVGSLGMLLPELYRNTILTNFLDPVHDLFFRILSCAAGPMIFLSVAWGIYGIGDTATLNRIGKKMIFSFIGTLFLILSVAALILLPFFNLQFSSSTGGSSGFLTIFGMFLDIVPTDIFSPFINGNSLQIIFMAFIIGIALLLLGKQTEMVAIVVEQINYIVQFLMQFISFLVPYFIFIAVLRFVWSDTVSTLISTTKVFLLYIPILLLMAVTVAVITGIKYKVNPLLLIRKNLPTLLIAITTASSAASFGTNRNACEKKFGIDSSITGFGIPLGLVMYKPSTAISYLIIAFYFAESYHIPVSVYWILIAVIVTGILAVSTPPIPGGALTAYTVIFLQLGIPSEALAVVLAVDVLLDFLCTGFDQFVLPYALISEASRAGLLDTKILREK